jgi:O-antigen/teichoic acid export membrane protein
LVTNLIANVLLIPRLQMFGAALAASGAYTIGTVFALVLLARQTRIPLVALIRPSAADFVFLRGVLRRYR